MQRLAALDQLLGTSLDRRDRAEIERHAIELSAGQLVAQRRQRGIDPRLAAAMDDDFHPGSGQRTRGGAANAIGRSGDQRDAAFGHAGAG